MTYQGQDQENPANHDLLVKSDSASSRIPQRALQEQESTDPAHFQGRFQAHQNKGQALAAQPGTQLR